MGVSRHVQYSTNKAININSSNKYGHLHKEAKVGRYCCSWTFANENIGG